MIGVDPESVEIHMIDPQQIGEAMKNTYSPNEFFEKIVKGAKAAGKTAKDVAKEMSDEAMKAHLSRNGFSEERIEEIMKETEENRKREEEAAAAAKKNKDALNNNVVFMTLKSIAAAHGYKLVNAYIKDGVPEATVELATNINNVGAPVITFSSQCGFGISTSGTYSGDGMDMVLVNTQKAVSCCKSLNSIDWRTWPTLE